MGFGVFCFPAAFIIQCVTVGKTTRIPTRTTNIEVAGSRSVFIKCGHIQHWREQ
jgi:hypothetical protein